MNYNSPTEIQSILDEYKLSLKKRWGQNFLINMHTRKKILDLISPQKDELIWEIGPGLGAIKSLLLKSKTNLVTFEIDWGLVKFLKKSLRSKSRVLIILKTLSLEQNGFKI